MYYYKIGIMEFKGTIILDASPALLGAINRIADIFSVDKVTIPQSPRVTLDQAGTLAVAEDARQEEASVPGVVTQTWRSPANRNGGGGSGSKVYQGASESRRRREEGEARRHEKDLG